MVMGGIGPDVLGLVEQWIPGEVYGHEKEYQAELKEFLDEQLNSGGGGPMESLTGPSGGYPVSSEHGTSYGDVVVDGTVGIELKRNFSNDQKKKLRGQLEDYAENYSFVIACACGVDDTEGWRELENRYAGSSGFGPDTTEFAFVVKERDRMGTEPQRNNSEGFLSGEGGFL